MKVEVNGEPLKGWRRFFVAGVATLSSAAVVILIALFLVPAVGLVATAIILVSAPAAVLALLLSWSTRPPTS